MAEKKNPVVKQTSVEIDGDYLVIRLPLQPPTPSSSGKTKVIASTHGNLPTQCQFDGKPVIVGVNAYIK